MSLNRTATLICPISEGKNLVPPTKLVSLQFCRNWFKMVNFSTCTPKEQWLWKNSVTHCKDKSVMNILQHFCVVHDNKIGYWTMIPCVIPSICSVLFLLFYYLGWMFHKCCSFTFQCSSVQVRIQCEPGGRLVIAGMPEDPENPWGVTPFRKVSCQNTLSMIVLHVYKVWHVYQALSVYCVSCQVILADFVEFTDCGLWILDGIYLNIADWGLQHVYRKKPVEKSLIQLSLGKWRYQIDICLVITNHLKFINADVCLLISHFSLCSYGGLVIK